MPFFLYGFWIYLTLTHGNPEFSFVAPSENVFTTQTLKVFTWRVNGNNAGAVWSYFLIVGFHDFQLTTFSRRYFYFWLAKRYFLICPLSWYNKCILFPQIQNIFLILNASCTPKFFSKVLNFCLWKTALHFSVELRLRLESLYWVIYHVLRSSFDQHLKRKIVFNPDHWMWVECSSACSCFQ